MNKVIVVGNNVKDIELKKTNSGKSVCEFTIAVNERFGDSETTEYIDCRAWDKNADNLSKYLKKGSKVLVEGKYHSETYDRNDGSKARKTMVVVHTFEFLSPKSEVDTQEPTYTPKPKPTYAQEPADDYSSRKLDFDTDELPFY